MKIRRSPKMGTFIEPICPECKHIVHGHTCTNCGLVLVERPIAFGENGYQKSEERNFDKYTMIPKTKHSKRTNNTELKRALKKSEHYERNMLIRYYGPFVEIGRICDYLQLPKTILDESIFLYDKLIKKNFFNRNKAKYAGCVAIIMLVCRKNRYPISFNEFFEMSDESKKKIINIFQEIRKSLQLQLPRITLRDHVIYQSNLLGIPQNRKMKMINLEKRVSKKINTSGKKLAGYSAAIIKLVNNISYDVLHEKLGIAKTTIYRRMSEIKSVR